MPGGSGAGRRNHGHIGDVGHVSNIGDVGIIGHIVIVIVDRHAHAAMNDRRCTADYGG